MSRKKILSITCLVFIFLWSLSAGAQNPPDRFQLTILHVNDTHSHLEQYGSRLTLNGETTYLNTAGFPRLASKIKDARKKTAHLLVLHAGDAVQGTLYFTKYQGCAEVDFNNLIGFDAMALGNHEFDKGSRVLTDFIRKAAFPILAANCDVSRNPNLKGLVHPYVIKTVGGEKIGVIGLISPDTPETSSPDADIVFTDDQTAAEEMIQTLEALGINKIILLTHLGYERDVELARRIDGIDVIVGGHTHTLLGDFKELGLRAEGPYPTKVRGPSGRNACIVHAWRWAAVMGRLEVSFDRNGHVLDCSGNPIILSGDTFEQKDAAGKKAVVQGGRKEALLAAVLENPEIEVIAEDAQALALLAPYKAGIDKLQHQVIASVRDDLWHERIPGAVHPVTGRVMKNGSDLAPLCAEAMLWKVDAVGQNATMAIQNAGGVRTDIEKGDLTVGKIYEVFPFGNTLYVLDLTGRQIRESLAAAVTRTLNPDRDGAFPYLAGARYSADMRKPEGERIVSLEVQTGAGQWTPIEPDAVYRMVTNSYLAGGGDGYSVPAKAKGYRYDTGFVDAEVFMEYAETIDPLRAPESTGVTYIK